MPDQALRRVRSFVRREGRMTAAQKDALEELWPRYGLDWPAAALLDLRQVFGREAPRVLEIGFGNGETFAAQVAANPGQDFLGIEVYRTGVAKLLRAAALAEARNLRVLCADATEVIASLAPASLDRVQIYFPDPWPKKRHHKRRLVQAGFAGQLARVLKPGGRLLLATDWRDYAEQMLAVLNAHAGFANLAADARCVPRPPERPLTRFEQRGIKLGHEVFDLAFRRVDRA